MSELHGSFATRLRSLVGPRSVREFARLTGIGNTTLQKYLDGAVPGLDKAQQIAAACEVSLEWLATGSEPAGIAAQIALPAEALAGGMVPVPLLEVRPSAGAGALVERVDDGPGAELVAFREDWLRRIGVSPRHARLMVCQGDSMHDTISDGDLMIVDVGVREIVDSGIYVLVYAGLVIVKRIQILRDRSVVLKSDNPRYEPETVPAHDLPELIIEGRVRWAGGSI